MIILYHNGATVVELANANTFNIDKASRKSIASVLIEVAKNYPEEILVWCDIDFKVQLNVSVIEKLLHHKKVILSYNPSNIPFLDLAIGYVDESPFIKVNKEVTFPTWQMSSKVGAVHSQVLLALKERLPFDKDFDYFLCSWAKVTMPLGLLCYSEPQLLKSDVYIATPKASIYTLFRFVKQHYRSRWLFLLLLDFLLYERKFPLLPFLWALFYKNRNNSNINLENINVQSTRKRTERSIDVIIPTIGRKEYLHDVLLDFAKQTLLPNTIIIVEQNPDEESKSELDYITDEKWPFKIQHIFTHQAGACNARNVALQQTLSEWVFFADDDICIEPDFLQKGIEKATRFGAKAFSVSCLQKGQKQIFKTVFQWVTFGSGCSFVLAESLKGCQFNKGYEFGFGEDGDFGMQLRNQGDDVLYLPQPEILHLKAPVGGFRTKPVLQWQNDTIQPKPSPTIMLYQILHNTQEQRLGYKTILFLKYYRHQKIKNPIRYYIIFQKQWKRSMYWAKELKKQNEI